MALWLLRTPWPIGLLAHARVPTGCTCNINPTHSVCSIAQWHTIESDIHKVHRIQLPSLFSYDYRHYVSGSLTSLRKGGV